MLGLVIFPRYNRALSGHVSRRHRLTELKWTWTCALVWGHVSLPSVLSIATAVLQYCVCWKRFSKQHWWFPWMHHSLRWRKGSPVVAMEVEYLFPCLFWESLQLSFPVFWFFLVHVNMLDSVLMHFERHAFNLFFVFWTCRKQWIQSIFYS